MLFHPLYHGLFHNGLDIGRAEQLAFNRRSLCNPEFSIFRDKFHWGRRNACLFVAVLALILGAPSSLGFGPLSFISWMGMSVLDIMDFASNSVLMPIVALGTCIFVGFIIRPKTISNEVKETDGKFKAEKLFSVMIKWVAPIFLVLILASSVASGLGWFSI